jgi:TolB-like protein/DNA-binding winged helix-turn-helix (wHTH) protein
VAIMAGLAQYVAFRFGSFTLDLTSGALLAADGREIPLRPKSHALLRFLVENAGRLLPREAIIETLWPDVYVTEDNVTQCIHDIRRALGIEARQIIRTLPRRGYIFTSQVTGVTQWSSPLRPTDHRDGGEIGIPPVEAYDLRPDVTAAASPDLRARNREALPLPEKPSIAVLAFTNLSGDPEEDYFADGLVEDIIWALSRVRWLFVIARNSSFTYKGRSVDVRQIGRELGVRYVLEGSVRRTEHRVRVAAQLIDASNGVHVWADRFDAASQDIFELQDLVAGSVAGQIEPQVRQTEIERANRRSVHNLDAYDLLLRAIGQIHLHTAASINEAVVLLRRALAIEPEYALAAALIADCRVIMQAQCWHILSDAEISETIDFARQAVRWGMDDPDALCWASLGLSIFANDRPTASNLIDRALLLNTNSAHAWSARAWLYCHQGQARAAIEAFERALRLSPLDPMGGYSKGGLALANLALENYEAASDWATQSLSELPRNVSAMRTNAAACAHLCRLDEARYWLEKLLELQPAMTIRAWRTSSGYSPGFLSMLEEGLRIAGLPEG